MADTRGQPGGSKRKKGTKKPSPGPRSRVVGKVFHESGHVGLTPREEAVLRLRDGKKIKYYGPVDNFMPTSISVADALENLRQSLLGPVLERYDFFDRLQLLAEKHDLLERIEGLSDPAALHGRLLAHGIDPMVPL